jgi:two-component system sensor histidine kinase UhpB
MSLFWRVFATNSLFLAVAALFVPSPLTTGSPTAAHEALLLASGLVGMLAVNAALLRQAFTPLEKLAHHIRQIDLLHPGLRFRPSGPKEVRDLIESLNTTLERLQAERYESARFAIAVQEAERKRVAAELHDEVGHTMTVVLMLLERLSGADAKLRQQLLAEAGRVIRAGVDEVRRMAQELRPRLLDQLGLASALTRLAQTFTQHHGIEVECRLARDLPALDSDVELALYRIAQESLTNAARHAGASRIWLTLAAGPDSVVLGVVDDGHGLQGGWGRGIRGMRDRAVIAGGELTVGTAATGGVEVRVEIPIRAP